MKIIVAMLISMPIYYILSSTGNYIFFIPVLALQVMAGSGWNK